MLRTIRVICKTAQKALQTFGTQSFIPNILSASLSVAVKIKLATSNVKIVHHSFVGGCCHREKRAINDKMSAINPIVIYHPLSFE